MDGQEIKMLRDRLGLTQKALAKMIGVRSNTIARWERGELGVSPAMAERLQATAQSLPSGTAITRTSGVILDPHHRAILKGLNGDLDPAVFENCAEELLESVWPGLVAVPGGRDDGFDGAVADTSTNESWPLIVTTGASFVTNLRASLDSAKRKGWKPERALFATSRPITPDDRRELRDAARKRKVTLAQVYGQDWFARRLYREPLWCKRLLGISGRPHALSVFPISRRPVFGDEVLGRELEFQWLLEIREDCLLVGEPGSGKTFLLSALAHIGKALFMVDEDREQIANDLRSLKPDAVIVDDAHARPSSVLSLMQLRRELDAQFRIIATCWPGDAERIGIELQIAPPDVLTLHRIDADTMIEIIKSVGLQGPRELLRIIRTQAAGRPGLAATLAHLCIVGRVDAATGGEGLVDNMAPDLDRVLGPDSMRLLAPFALAGDAGVRQEDVAERLGMSLLDVSSALATLGAAGIIRERRDSAISVEPPPMRWVLVRRFFFGGPGALPVERFLPAVRNRLDALETLIGAHARGADIPNLERLLEEAESERLWALYASIGPETTRYVLTRQPEIIKELAQPVLEHLPETAIPILLSRIAGDRDVETVLESALHPLQQWIQSGNSRGFDETIKRRQILLKAAEAWWHDSRNSTVSIAAMCVALDPNFDYVSQDPGAGSRITFATVRLGPDVINALASSWPAVMSVVNEATDASWLSLLVLIETWCIAQLSQHTQSQEAASQFVSLMLTDLASASRQFPGVQHRIASIAKREDVSVSIRLDPQFECLYPRDSFEAENADAEAKRRAANAREFAERQSNCNSNETARMLGRLEHEADRASITYPRLVPEFCQALAAAHPDPAAAVEAFMHERLATDAVEPLLRKAVDFDRRIWSVVHNCINDQLYFALGVKIAICIEHAPPEIVTTALDKIKRAPRLVDQYCAVGEVPKATLSRLFRSTDAATAVSAAIGHWKAIRHGRSGIEIDKAWRLAFLRSAERRLSSIDSYWIGEILQKNSELVPEWLIRLLNSDKKPLGYHSQKTAKKLAASMDSAQRLSVLSAIRPRRLVLGMPEVIHSMVGNDASVYHCLLQSEELKHYHLAPLLGEPNSDWREIAVLALDHGYSCDEVLKANLYKSRSWSGKDSAMWAELRSRFEELYGDEDSRIAELARRGAQTVGKKERRAKEREREEAVYGFS